MQHIRLSESHAAIHNIFNKDCVAVFYDINSDGVDEILGTHYASALNGNGECLLYVLQKVGDGEYKEITGEEVYFNVQKPICILLKQRDGYKNFQVYSDSKNDDITYSYNHSKHLYFKK